MLFCGARRNELKQKKKKSSNFVLSFFIFYVLLQFVSCVLLLMEENFFFNCLPPPPVSDIDPQRTKTKEVKDATEDEQQKREEETKYLPIMAAVVVRSLFSFCGCFNHPASSIHPPSSTTAECRSLLLLLQNYKRSTLPPLDYNDKVNLQQWQECFVRWSCLDVLVDKEGGRGREIKVMTLFM